MRNTNRLEWDIFQKVKWIAYHNESGRYLLARTKSDLMSKINKFEKVFLI